MAAKGSTVGKHNARFQQTMLRVKDPQKSCEFYREKFGMQLVHKYDFNQWKFSTYFLEIPQAGVDVPGGGQKGTTETEKYLWSMDGCCLELTHNHGTEDDDSFKVWNGNTGGDAEGDLKADPPKYRGFGHIAFNTDNIEEACAKLEAKGVKFHKKLSEGTMKDIAFALDPDGYWIEIVQRRQQYASPYNLSQTMLRVKDGNESVKFYTEQLGMTLVRKSVHEEAKFTLYFLASLSDPEIDDIKKKLPKEELDAMDGKIDPEKENSVTKMMFQPCIELTWNHGTEGDTDFKVHDGNAVPQGFGHVGFLVDDIEKCCADLDSAGVKFKKKPTEGGMKHVAFCYDPNGYFVEIIQRGCSFQPHAANISS